MTTGLVLIFSILILGGVIATAGDRIGMKVGKARLSLFNLRPRQTATIITILTGGVISATTLGILFAVSEQLRTGVFELGEIQDDLESARQDLGSVQREKSRIEDELAEAQDEQQAARDELRTINESLSQAVARQEETAIELAQVEDNYAAAQQRLEEVSQQTQELQAELVALRQESREVIEQRDRRLAAREREIAEKEAQLQVLEQQRTNLAQEVVNLEQELVALEQELQSLREGNVALLNNQLLTAGVVRIVDEDGARQVVDQLLRRANRVVLEALLPGTELVQAQVVQITNTQVEQLVERLQSGEDYVVRILSGGNYLVGEPCVLAGQTCIQVIAEAVPNQLVFQPGEVIAATTVPPTLQSQEQLAEKLELLIAATQFRAQQAGVLSDSVRISANQEEAITYFFDQLLRHQQDNGQSFTIQAIASESISTTGPLSIDLVVIQDGEQLFSTGDDWQEG